MRIAHDAEHRSRLVLPVLDENPQLAATPAPCPSLRAEPCRTYVAPAAAWSLAPRPLLDSALVSKANKRERQRQNRELAKVERDRLIKRDRRMRTLRSLLFVLVPVAVIFVVIYFLRDDNKGTSSTDSALSKVHCQDVPKSKKIPKKDTNQTAPAQTIDPAKTYTATMETSCGTITLAARRRRPRRSRRTTSSSSRAKGFYDGLPFHRAAEGLRDPGRRPEGRRLRRPGLHGGRRGADGQLPDRIARRGEVR